MPVRKVFTPVGVTFKGGGFYKTDSRGKSATRAKKDETSSTSKDSPSKEASSKDSASKDSTSTLQDRQGHFVDDVGRPVETEASC